MARPNFQEVQVIVEVEAEVDLSLAVRISPVKGISPVKDTGGVEAAGGGEVEAEVGAVAENTEGEVTARSGHLVMTAGTIM